MFDNEARHRGSNPSWCHCGTLEAAIEHNPRPRGRIIDQWDSSSKAYIGLGTVLNNVNQKLNIRDITVLFLYVGINSLTTNNCLGETLNQKWPVAHFQITSIRPARIQTFYPSVLLLRSEFPWAHLDFRPLELSQQSRFLDSVGALISNPTGTR